MLVLDKRASSIPIHFERTMLSYLISHYFFTYFELMTIVIFMSVNSFYFSLFTIKVTVTLFRSMCVYHDCLPKPVRCSLRLNVCRYVCLLIHDISGESYFCQEKLYWWLLNCDCCLFTVFAFGTLIVLYVMLPWDIYLREIYKSSAPYQAHVDVDLLLTFVSTGIPFKNVPTFS